MTDFKLVKSEDLEMIISLEKTMRIDEEDTYSSFDENAYKENWQKYPIELNLSSDVIACIKDNEIIGRIDLMYERSYMDFSVVGYVDWIYIKPKYRGKGYGKSLLLEAEKQFKDKGCCKFYLFIAKNEQAIKFYDSTDLEITTMKTGVKNF